MTGTAQSTNGGSFAGGNGGNGGGSSQGGGSSAGGTNLPGGGGGGDGGNGAVFSVTGASLINTGTGSFSGGRGGNGGSVSGAASQSNGGYGGRGGAGVSFGSTFTLTNQPGGQITGGDGGTGGNGGTDFPNQINFRNGNGGQGGAGVIGSGGTITNAGTITGGNGAAAGTGGRTAGTAGVGGYGITGSDLIIVNSGIIRGGVSNASGAGAVQADAVHFTGGTNSFTITSTSQLQGNVVATGSGNNTFGLGGDATPTTSFSLAQLGAVGSGTQYQGFGILQKSGASTWSLAGTPGANVSLTYQVIAGTLNLGGTAQTATSLQMIGGTLAGGTLTVNTPGGFDVRTGTISAVLAGTGGLTKTTAGTVSLSGTDTYTGATTINAGTLALTGAGSVAASSGVALATGATFDVAGVGNGSTSVKTLGNTGAGQTGTVNLGAATLTLTNAAGTFGGMVQGTGGLTLAAGTQILTGASTYAGATTINGGTLQVDGSIASPNVVVNNGGTLAGTGKIGDPQINAGGTLAPGNAANPTGTLTIVGPLGFAAGSFYNVNITPTANSRTNVVGTTTIAGGTVNVMAGSGTYATNTRYTILTSTGGVAGTFTRATATTNFAFLTPTLSYDANDVYLTVLPMAPIVTTNPMTGAPTTVPNYRTVAGTQNQLAVASGLTNAGIRNGGTGRVLTALNQLTAPQARAAFDSLSGEGITAAQNIANRSAQLFTSSIFDQTTFYGPGAAGNAIILTEPIRELADVPASRVPPVFVQPNRTWRAWATGYGGVDDIHGNGAIGSSTQQNTIYGGTLGVDYQMTPNYLVGVAIGGSNGDFLVPGRATSGSSTGGHVALYDLATFGSFYGASSTSFSYFGNRSTRTVAGFGGLGNETERGNFDSHEFRSRLEFGRHFAGYGGVLTPFVALELAELRSNGFTESTVQGAGLFRLNVSGQSQASVPAFVGVRLQRATALGNGITLSPTLQVAYVHEFAPYRSQIGTLADLPGSTFLVDGARPARDAAQVKAGAEMRIGANSVLYANFDGEFSGVNKFYAGKGGFRFSW